MSKLYHNEYIRELQISGNLTVDSLISINGVPTDQDDVITLGYLNNNSFSGGVTGPTGPDGLDGQIGDTGNIGENGLDGPIGSTGSTGANGFVGSTGIYESFDFITGINNISVDKNISYLTGLSHTIGTPVINRNGFYKTIININNNPFYPMPLNSGFNTGFNDTVNALTVLNNDIYAGGKFTRAQNFTTVNRIARWSPSSNRWFSLSSGVSGEVFALTSMGSDLFAGGSFLAAGGSTVNNIARWNTTSSTWSAIGNGVLGTVSALVVSGTDLYVGGSFNTANGSSANRVARWNSSSGWSSIPSGGGVNNGVGGGTVSALAVIGNDLFVGGSFSTAGGNSVNRIVKWNSTTGWSDMNGGVIGTSPIVNAFAVSGNDLYVGGNFTSAGGVSVSNIAKYNNLTNEWSNFGLSVNGTVRSLAIYENNLLVGGLFQNVNNISLNAFIKWNLLNNTLTNFSGFSAFHIVNAITTLSKDIYVGGQFSSLGDFNNTTMLNIARFSNTQSILGNFINNGNTSSSISLPDQGDSVVLTYSDDLGRWVISN